MADKTCKIIDADIPNEYQEINCSNRTGDNGSKRAFICKNGYEMNPPTDSLYIDDTGDNACIFDSCKPIPYTIPTIGRPSPDNSDIYECITKDTDNLQQRRGILQKCLKFNRGSDPQSNCSQSDECVYDKYKGDYLITKKNNSVDPGTTELISWSENELINKPDKCYNPDTLELSNKEMSGPTKCSNPSDYFIETATPLDNNDNNDKYNLNYKITDDTGNSSIGTTTEKLLYKLKREGSVYYPGLSVASPSKALTYSCNTELNYIGNPGVSYPSVGVPSLSGCIHGEEVNNLESSYIESRTVNNSKYSTVNPSTYMDSIQWDMCEMLTEAECPKNETCFWNDMDNNNNNHKCSNKCSARSTKGECDQFYDTNQLSVSDTIYNFDGKDHKCKWFPSYFNEDITSSSTDGVCRPRITNSFKSTSAQSECSYDIKGRNEPIKGTINNGYCLPTISELKGIYCNYNYISKYEDICLKRNIGDCLTDNTDSEGGLCEVVTRPRKCISDGKKYIDNTSGVNIYRDDAYCGNLKSGNCTEKGCIEVPTRTFCESNDINKLINTEDITSVCVPLKAQIPENYDINLLVEEDINTSAFSQKYNKKPPYFTSRYLCDICTVRDNDIKKGYNRHPSNLKDENNQTYCEKSIDLDDPNGRVPCKWDGDANKCMSRCKQVVQSDPTKHLTNDNIERLKQKCSQTHQYNDGDKNTIEFPNLDSDNNSVRDKYYDELYCTWDGFECHNSIPCKDTQRIRCEDMGYHWYEGTANDVEIDKERLGTTSPITLTDSYPQKRKGDGDPLTGDAEGICIFPNKLAKSYLEPAKYIIKNSKAGNHFILLKWYEYGSGWWNDASLNKRDSSVPGSNTDNYFMGEHIALIPYIISGSETTSAIQTIINNALASYKYYVLNGKHLVWDAYIQEWVQSDAGKTLLDNNYTETQRNVGWEYYTGNTDIGNGSSDDEHYMCHVIHDLRGIINIIPVINGNSLIHIKTFNIEGDTGNVILHMDGDNHFIFNGFLDDITEIETYTMVTLNKFNWNHDKDNPNSNPHWGLPPSIGEGYGFLYDNIKEDSYTCKVPAITTIGTTGQIDQSDTGQKTIYEHIVGEPGRTVSDMQDNLKRYIDQTNTPGLSYHYYALLQQLLDIDKYGPTDSNMNSEEFIERLSILKKPV